jgi:hypothetical protein
MLTLPQGELPLGRWTSLRTGVPLTPSAGERIACAETCDATARTETRVIKDFPNMFDE